MQGVIDLLYLYMNDVNNVTKIKTMKKDFDFKKTKEHLTTIDKLEDKIKYLLEVQTDYLQTENYWEIELVPFDKKCSLEIKKLYELIDLRDRNRKNRSTQNPKI